ncbi:acyl carrier protein [Butyricimonas virosa]|jgi:acyl carrier protein|uniref:Acyl carrier protein n=1 Tax=Butyricimonas virosa TaxID=544645 RepID=A0A413INW4_9BACT|nr:acyl carrier protein [Butyricimonas virosa]MCI7295638.1 acyl carrier protein [Butyricimonas virosa]MCI7391208.1 acyl carrier protein [Butyricimonas virosa]MDY4906070.1 acyl carrier protein [Butyricimonas virosa]MDY5487551.1 acyl carrier protein [Butyricimonas virosa]MDY6220468.1 acyl carrier protein [Butyricimonas virosa]
MELKEFIEHFAEQFEETPVESFMAETVFKDLDEWSSLMALVIIGMVDEEFGVVLKGEDIRNSQTIEDLYKQVKNGK